MLGMRGLFIVEFFLPCTVEASAVPVAPCSAAVWCRLALAYCGPPEPVLLFVRQIRITRLRYGACKYVQHTYVMFLPCDRAQVIVEPLCILSGQVFNGTNAQYGKVAYCGRAYRAKIFQCTVHDLSRVYLGQSTSTSARSITLVSVGPVLSRLSVLSRKW